MELLYKAVWVMGKLLLGLLVFIVLYVLIEVVFSRIAVAEETVDAQVRDIDLYIYSNGVHTDIVLPIRSDVIDWSLQISPMDTQAQRQDMEFISFGWGDKGFYLETPEWRDLKPSVAFKAAFYLGSSAMHTTFYKQMIPGDRCVKVKITSVQYRDLIAYIQNSFQRDPAGDILLIDAVTYGKDDSFYEAKRTYGLFYTCNTWANNALKAAGLRACLWTASDRGILYQYRNYNRDI